MNSTANNVTWNLTASLSEDPALSPVVRTFIRVLSNAIILVLMLGLSATVEIKSLKDAVKDSWRGLVACFLGQVFVLPTAAFGIIHLFSLSTPRAVALLIVACCPGGTFSNVLIYFAGGNMLLSLFITTITTALALITLPSLLLFWCFVANIPSAIIPYSELMVSLALIILPVACGILVRRKSKKAAKVLERIAAGLGAIIAVAGIAVAIASNYQHIGNADILPWTTLAAMASLAVVAPVVGLAFSFMPCWYRHFDSVTDRCVVVIETGVQNTALATAIVNLTFVSSSSVEFLSVALCPAMYTIFSNTQMFILAGAVRHHLARQRQRERKKRVAATDTTHVVATDTPQKGETDTATVTPQVVAADIPQKDGA